jgi:tRNA-dihydrouridine synthase B
MLDFIFKFVKNFWQKLKTRADKGNLILALAPMAGYTDSAFRQICKEFGADIVYSEMASAAALANNPVKTLEIIEFDKKERPYIVQLFGSKPEHFAAAVKIVSETKPDGIDINFGCPVKKVQKQGAGAILMNNIKLAQDIIKATVNASGLPVSIKIRSRVGEVDALKFLDKVGNLGIHAVMIHGRTLKQGHAGPVDFETIKKARNFFGGIILANGGAMDLDSSLELLDRTGADGIGIGRGALGRPWIFKEIKIQNSKFKNNDKIFDILFEHANLVARLKGEKGIVEFRKQAVWYVKGMPDAAALRSRIIKIENLEDLAGMLGRGN